MTFCPPRSVVSGEPYIVRQVRDRDPERLDDFAGETTFVVDLDDEGYRVCGPGVPADEGMRVFEKSDAGAGKDVLRRRDRRPHAGRRGHSRRGGQREAGWASAPPTPPGC